MADDFCKFFDVMMEKYTLKSNKKRCYHYHRDSTMSKAEIMLIMLLFHDSGYRCLKHFLSGEGVPASTSSLPQSCLIQSFRGTRERGCYTFGSVHQESLVRKMHGH